MVEHLEITPLTEEELDAIEERVNKATPGPWKSYIEGREEISGSSFIMTAGEDIYLTGGSRDDQDFIAQSRHDVAKLLQEVRRLRSQIAAKLILSEKGFQ